jgi:hypothetical protein
LEVVTVISKTETAPIIIPKGSLQQTFLVPPLMTIMVIRKALSGRRPQEKNAEQVFDN